VGERRGVNVPAADRNPAVIPSVVEGCAKIDAIECERAGASSGLKRAQLSTARAFALALNRRDRGSFLDRRPTAPLGMTGVF
jgi:hypothetical protein